MKLQESNELSDLIIKKAKEHQTNAMMFAKLYAQSNDKNFQRDFQLYEKLEKECYDLHAIVCSYLHKIETYIPEKKDEKKI